MCGYGGMADTLASGANGSNTVQVQVLLSAPIANNATTYTTKMLLWHAYGIFNSSLLRYIYHRVVCYRGYYVSAKAPSFVVVAAYITEGRVTSSIRENQAQELL